MNTKRFLSLMLSLVMLFAVVFPTGGFADDYFEEYEEPQDEVFWEDTWNDSFVEEYVEPAFEDGWYGEDTLFEEDYSEPEEFFADEMIDEDIQPEIQEEVIDENIQPEIQKEAVDENNDSEADAPVEAALTLADNDVFNTGAFEITQQPEDVTAAIGEAVTFTVKATGAESYQWQYHNGSTWKNCSAANGGQSTTYTTAASETRYKYTYHCVITDKAGEEHITNDVKILEPVAFEITKQPVDVTAAIGENVEFTVEATGVASYQWQYSGNGKTWYNCKATAGGQSTTYTTIASETRYKYTYRCVLKNKAGEELITNEVRIISPSIVVDDVIYTPIDSISCKVVGYQGNLTSLTVQNEVNGMTVVEIGEEAFMNNTTLESIKLPSTITVIRARAFKGCTSLREMN